MVARGRSWVLWTEHEEAGGNTGREPDIEEWRVPTLRAHRIIILCNKLHTDSPVNIIPLRDTSLLIHREPTRSLHISFCTSDESYDVWEHV